MAEIVQAHFGHTAAGAAVERYTLRNSRGMEAQIATYGGIVTRLTAPDRDGRYADVVLGYDSLDGYLACTAYVGALIGRYGNRIARGRFTLDGVTHTLPINDGPNSLHGGWAGFGKVPWRAVRAAVTAQGPQLTLHHLSVDGEQGYPGNLSVTAVYTLTEDDALCLEYCATTDKNTVINLTQHSYFNLRGTGDVLDHIVTIPADRYIAVDRTLIPTGELRPVAGTAFDFRQAAAIGARISETDEQLNLGRGYDHSWVLSKPCGKLDRVATVDEPDSGRRLEVFSTEPCLQFYAGNSLDGSMAGKRGRAHGFRGGFSLEPQRFPDSPNQPNFPAAVLHPGETYRSTITQRFSAS